MRRIAAGTPRRKRSAQRGQTLLLLVILIIGVGAVFYTFVGFTGSAIERDKITAAALAQAKEALIGFAASDSNRPGSLPCPDFDDGTINPLNTANDGTADLYAGNECPGYVASSNVYLGRLPWRTLRLPDLRDGSGERLWYAVSRAFARNPACSPNCPLNSDTLGQLTVTGVAPAGNVVAVIFAPGSALGNQPRDAAGENTASNYLEGENSDGNNFTFTTQASSTTFNDRLLVVPTADLMTRVEQRVARELLKVLQAYKANSGCNCYPWPDVSTGFSDFGINRGRVPGYDLAGTTSPPYALPVDWGVGGAPTLPQWFIDNGWRRIIYYAVGKNFLQSSGAGCTTCEPWQTTLSVDGVWGREVVLLTPGPPGAGRPAPYPWTNWTLYLDDAENNDHSNDRYVTPISPAYARDRIFTIP